MLPFCRRLHAASTRIKFQCFTNRHVTYFASQQKLEEKKRLQCNDMFLVDAPEKLQDKADIKAREAQHNMPRASHLILANSKLQAHIKAETFEAGWELFESIPDADAALCNAALSLCAKAAWKDRAWVLWKQMPPASKDIISHGVMMDVCARCHQGQEAEDIFDGMVQAGIKPNLISYNSLVKACAMSKRFERARDIFESIPAELLAGASLKNQRVAYQLVMSACARNADYAACRELFVRMTEASIMPDSGHFNSLMTACASKADAETAQAIFDLMPHYNIVPGAADWTVLISCNKHNLSRCVQLLQLMQESRLSPSGLAYQELLEAHVIAKDGAGARKLLKEGDKLGNWLHSQKVGRLRIAAESLV